MGIGIFIPGADFSNLNLGQITPLQDIPVTAIAITINASYSGTTFTPLIAYTPSNSNKKGVTWSITAGGTYATINATTGVVTILSAANASSITIQAVSTYDSSIIATATTSVTYVEQVIDVTSVTITGADTMSLNGSLTAAILPTNATAKTVTWAVTSGADLVTMTANGNTANFVVKSSGSITVTATAGGVTATKTIAVSDTMSDSSIIQFESAITKAFIVSHYDLDGDGEITVGEMKAITHTGATFETATIDDFNEFQYLTGLTGVNQTDYNAGFKGNTNLKKITLPKNFVLTAPNQNTAQNYFQGCTGLTEVHFPENFVANSNYNGGYTENTLPSNMFNGCTSLVRCRIPNNVTTLGYTVFGNCSSMKDVILGTSIANIQSNSVPNQAQLNIVILNPTAVVAIAGSITFSNVAAIYVPDALYTQYINSSYWSASSAKIVKLSTYTGDINTF